MGATKSNLFTQTEIDLAIAARAMSHPARIAIINHLKHSLSSRNTDLSNLLKLSKPTIHDHILKLRDAGLVEGEFAGHTYSVTLNPTAIEHFSCFITEMVNEA